MIKNNDHNGLSAKAQVIGSHYKPHTTNLTLQIIMETRIETIHIQVQSLKIQLKFSHILNRSTTFPR